MIIIKNLRLKAKFSNTNKTWYYQYNLEKKLISTHFYGLQAPKRGHHPHLLDLWLLGRLAPTEDGINSLKTTFLRG